MVVRGHDYFGMIQQISNPFPVMPSHTLADGHYSNIDRILSASAPSSNGMLSYKDHGMLLCEVHVLRQSAGGVMPGEIYAEFLEEINDLVELRTGVERQIRVVDRIRWAYARWMI